MILLGSYRVVYVPTEGTPLRSENCSPQSDQHLKKKDPNQTKKKIVSIVKYYPNLRNAKESGQQKTPLEKTLFATFLAPPSHRPVSQIDPIPLRSGKDQSRTTDVDPCWKINRDGRSTLQSTN